ncbi:MAG: hypothetical protein SPI27_03480, partial [Bacteroidaceae bacterium]|nr:hypothetical protein [Bacteroidaceae bacterium]
KNADFVVSTYLAKYLNILCHLSLDTLPFMSTYFFEGVLGNFNSKACHPQPYMLPLSGCAYNQGRLTGIEIWK